MSSRVTFVVGLIVIAAALAIGLAAYSRLPEQVASHWNAADQVDGTMPRFWGAFLMPAIAVLLLALFLLIPSVDPLKANIAKFRGSFNAFIVVILAFLLYVHVLAVLWNLGLQGFRMSVAILPALGVLLVFIGTLLRRAKRNYFIGIRTPWTLSSDSVWERTHRVGSVLFTISGVLAVLAILLPGPSAYLVVVGTTLVSAIGTLILSYFLWRAEQNG